MRTIVAGSRGFPDKEFVLKTLSELSPPVTVVISGMAYGPDLWAVHWAHQNNIPIEPYPAQWKQHGRGAGFIRNMLMAEVAERLVAFWDGESRGTAHMIAEAKRKKLAVIEIVPYPKSHT